MSRHSHSVSPSLSVGLLLNKWRLHVGKPLETQKGWQRTKTRPVGARLPTKQTFQRGPLAACLGSTGLRSQHKQGINTAARGGGAGVNIKDNTFLPAASGVKWCNNYCMCEGPSSPVQTAPASAEHTFIRKPYLWKCKTAADSPWCTLMQHSR